MNRQYTTLAQCIAVEKMLLTEKKWLEWVLKYIAQERNSIQIETLELASRQMQIFQKNMCTTQNEEPLAAGADEAITSAVNMMQNEAVAKRTEYEKLRKERGVTVPPYEELIDNIEELNLSTINPFLGNENQQESEEEDEVDEEDEEDEEDEMDFIINMNNMFMGSP